MSCWQPSRCVLLGSACRSPVQGSPQVPARSGSLAKAAEEVGVLSQRRGRRCWLSTRPRAQSARTWEPGAQRQAGVCGPPAVLLGPHAFLSTPLASMSAQNWPKDGLLILIPLQRSLPPLEPGEPGNTAEGTGDTSASPSPMLRPHASVWGEAGPRLLGPHSPKHCCHLELTTTVQTKQ